MIVINITKLYTIKLSSMLNKLKPPKNNKIFLKTKTHIKNMIKSNTYHAISLSSASLI